jgi:hypothetical protein
MQDGNKAVVRTSARKVKDTQKLGVWLEGFNTIVGISAELVKEMEGIAKKIEALNHQIADLEALRKDGDQKENATSLEKVYKAEKSQLVNEVNNCLKKKGMTICSVAIVVVVLSLTISKWQRSSTLDGWTSLTFWTRD